MYFGNFSSTTTLKRTNSPSFVTSFIVFMHNLHILVYFVG